MELAAFHSLARKHKLSADELACLCLCKSAAAFRFRVEHGRAGSGELTRSVRCFRDAFERLKLKGFVTEDADGQSIGLRTLVLSVPVHCDEACFLERMTVEDVAAEAVMEERSPADAAGFLGLSIPDCDKPFRYNFQARVLAANGAACVECGVVGFDQAITSLAGVRKAQAAVEAAVAVGGVRLLRVERLRLAN